MSLDLPSNMFVENQQDIILVDPSGGILSSSLSGNALNFGPNIISTNAVYTYYLLHSVDLDSSSSYPPSPSCLSDPNLECTFGVPDLLKGLSTNNIDLFFPCDETNYLEFKDQIDYPSKREFNLNISSTTYSFVCNSQIPGNSDNVYSMTWSDYILGQNGLKEPVTINLKVW
jgi:hypothetical protein